MAAKVAGFGTPPSGLVRRLFPQVANVFDIITAIVKGIARMVAAGWRSRVELVFIAVAVTVVSWLTSVTGDLRVALVVTITPTLAVVLVWRFVPGVPDRVTRWLSRHWTGRVVLWLGASLSRSGTRRRLREAMRNLRTANARGRLPIIRSVKSTVVGETVIIGCRPGQSAEMLEIRAEEFRAALKSRDVRIAGDPTDRSRVVIDVVRRDPLTATETIGWADAANPSLSVWDPVHMGTDENGKPLRLSFVERSLLMGGEPGSGKSSAAQPVISHWAKSFDGELILLDPNEVQFGPWEDRALAFASDDMDDAVEALALVRTEIDRRKRLLRSLSAKSGRIYRKVTREIADGEGLRLWLVAVDELAYYTSVIGTLNSPFAKMARDIVARGRAFGIIPLMATQRPTSDVVPTSLRDLFSLRFAFRVTTAASSDVILGENWARRGYSAVDIDIENRGSGWLLAEGSLPRKVKAPWIADEQIASWSASTTGNRGTPNIPDALPALEAPPKP